jgi:hypothetical protein
VDIFTRTMFPAFKPPNISKKEVELRLKARGVNKPKARNSRLRLNIMLIQDHCDKHSLHVNSIEENVMELLQNEHAKNSDLYGPYTFKGVTPRANSRQVKFYTFYRAVNAGQLEPPKIHIRTCDFAVQFAEKGGMSLKAFIASKEKLKPVKGPFLPPLLQAPTASSAASTEIESDNDD